MHSDTKHSQRWINAQCSAADDNGLMMMMMKMTVTSLRILNLRNPAMLHSFTCVSIFLKTLVIDHSMLEGKWVTLWRCVLSLHTHIICTLCKVLLNLPKHEIFGWFDLQFVNKISKPFFLNLQQKTNSKSSGNLKKKKL